MTFKFRVIIAGSRGFSNYSELSSYCDKVLSKVSKTHKIQIISGCAFGADKLGEKYAESRGYEVNRFPAQWDTYGRSAGYIRNEEMAKNADALIAFWDGKSNGTRHMINLAKKYNLKISICRYE